MRRPAAWGRIPLPILHLRRWELPRDMERQPGADAAEVELWLAFCDTISLQDAERLYRSALSPSENDRFQRFVHDHDRHSYLLSHVVLRRALSSHAPVAPQDWVFSAGEFGKPRLSGPVQLPHGFNLSHTRGAVACAIAAARPVGIDLQVDPGAGLIASLSHHVFSDQEAAMLNRLSTAERDRTATRLWTLKEALAKAIGVGIRLPFHRIDFCLEPDRPARLRSSPPDIDPAAWDFASIEMRSQYWMSIAVPAHPRRALRVRLHECVGEGLKAFTTELPGSAAHCWRFAGGGAAVESLMS